MNKLPLLVALTSAAPAAQQARRRGLSLVQWIVALGAISLLAIPLFNVFSNQRASSRRAQCDVHLKQIALALDTHRQDRGVFPAKLQDLRTKHYIHEENKMHCPNDLREGGSYGDFYVIRAPYDADNLPTLVCPFHEPPDGYGAQAFKGKYTKQFATRPARLEMTSGATIERPGEAPTAVSAGGLLNGGDRIRTAIGGSAIIRFADNSSCDLQGNSDVTVLQSFVSSTGSPLCTLVRQSLGTVTYRVNRGSQFDVATSKATTGATGGVFRITVNANAIGTLTVIAGRVSLSTLKNRLIAGPAIPIPL